MMRRNRLSLSKLRIKMEEQIKLQEEIKDLKLEEIMKEQKVEDQDKLME